MLPFQIKICGVTSCEDALCACQCGADAVGLNFYERSSRFVEPETARLIARSIDDHNREIAGTTSPVVKKIGVFVDMPVAEIVSIAKHIGLDGIQLHGNESPKILPEIRSELTRLRHLCVLIRAVRLNPDSAIDGGSNPENRLAVGNIQTWIEQGVDLILLDAAVPGEYGGTGKSLDASNLPPPDGHVPFVLAGGLTPENIELSIKKSGYRAVDVASGVESAPGLKDHLKVRSFVDTARRTFDLKS